MQNYIEIKGARQHNLKDINLKIPKNKLVVFTGLSGSGKSSLAFDTIYAEGQRRYVESLSSYARQFLGIMSKPDVDSIDGLSPAISIDQKTTSHNPRSTVGTITEIYDYLRLLFARIGHPHCPNCGREISKQSIDQIIHNMLETIDQDLHSKPLTRIAILAPIVRDKKGEFTDLLENLRKKGFALARVDNHFLDLDEDIVLIKTNKHSISAVVDRLSIDQTSWKSESRRAEFKSRLTQSVETALELTNGLAILTQIFDTGFDFPKAPQDTQDHLYSEQFACPECNISLPEIEPRIFSFNSPQGACPTCNGLGALLKVNPQQIVAPEISLSEGAIIPLSKILGKNTWYTRLVATVVAAYNGSMRSAFNTLPDKLQHILLYGDDLSRTYTVFGVNRLGRETSIEETFDGFVAYLQRKYDESESDFVRKELEKFMHKAVCPTCQGSRLKQESLAVTIDQLNIAQVAEMPIKQTLTWIQRVNKSVLSQKEIQIGQLILKELDSRLQFLNSVGLNYLNLSREAGTLAGGEAQRIRLASQIGTGLSGVLYILDEPSIGLHPRDNDRLINTLKYLRDLGNNVIVVEHDTDTMLESDYIFDFGPGAGKQGGVIVAEGSPDEILKHPQSLTGKYLTGKKTVEIDKKLKTEISKLDNNSNLLHISGCRLHNLKNISVEFPLNTLTCITGVSGSGKSTLMHDTLYKALSQKLNRNYSDNSKIYEQLNGYQQVNRVSMIDQSPIGRTPRSNPATYTKIFDIIRQIFANTREAQTRGYTPGRFSFNVKGGRCEACQGDGQVKIEMQFLPDVYVTCEVCQGARYNSETLEVRYKGKTIADVLHMTVEEAVEFFHNHGTLKQKIQTLVDVGLGYIELGQPATTLSGGEAQRIKLARELAIKGLGHTVYLLDEPTTGLHFEDVRKLLNVLYKLVTQNNTVILIEHNLDVIKNCQYLIDLGPEGGEQGGHIITTGTPKQVAEHQSSFTGKYLAKIFASS